MGNDDIRIFLAIAHHEDVAGAARSLGMAESEFANHLEALCLGTGARMLKRTSSGYALTEAGAATLAHFRWIKTAVVAAEHALQS